MASIGSVRKTSNGCPVATRVKRKDAGFRVPSGNIAAIDFGTTNCSLAYITVADKFEEGPKRLPLNSTFYRVPTAILFKPDGSIDSFGYAARDQYLNLEDEDRLKYTYFEQIKMDLQHDETVSREMKVTGSNGKEYYLVDVIAQILKYLKNELIVNHLQRGGHPLEATDFDWVITVPAIWKARGKQMMREAGYKAGLCSEETCGSLRLASTTFQRQASESAPDKLSLALEPESAALYSQQMKQENAAAYCKSAHPYTASCYLVVDIGGGTVDISAHRSSSSGHVQVVHPPTGNDCGGSRVNKRFESFLEELVGDPKFSRYLNTYNVQRDAKHRADLNYLLNDTFERQKKNFGSRESDAGKFSVRLPYSFMTTYQADIQRGLRQYDRTEVYLSGGELRISHSKMGQLFSPIVNGILACVAQTLNEVDTRIEAIYLVGGFGGCHFIYTAIHDRFGDAYKYVVPAEPDFAVVRGAVIFRRNPKAIQARRVDATYGVAINFRFDSSIHCEEYRWTDDDGRELCDNIFQTVVERGDSISSEYVYTTELCPVQHNTTKLHFPIHSSLEKDVWYTTGKRGKRSLLQQPATVQKIGEFSVDMPILTGDKSRVVDVTFDFGHTEIQVKGYDRASKNEVKTVLDFLSS